MGHLSKLPGSSEHKFNKHTSTYGEVFINLGFSIIYRNSIYKNYSNKLNKAKEG